MDLRLTGKTALVTGASKGIGAAAARTLAREGCDVTLVARSEDALRAQAEAIAAETGRRIDIIAADLSRAEEVERVAAAASAPDILVNNAGAIPPGTIDEIDDARWREAWDLKVFGYVNLMRALLPGMRARGSGVIVNIIGAAAQIRNPAYACGVAGNAALTALTMSLGSNSPADGVRVLGISPGPVATERLTRLGAAASHANALPFGRAADVDEIAAAVAFLASPLSGYTTGTVLMIDGGISARAAS